MHAQRDGTPVSESFFANCLHWSRSISWEENMVIVGGKPLKSANSSGDTHGWRLAEISPQYAQLKASIASASRAYPEANLSHESPF